MRALRAGAANTSTGEGPGDDPTYGPSRLGRDGHYCVAGDSGHVCLAAKVVGEGLPEEDGRRTVHLAVWQHDGLPANRLNVPIDAPRWGPESATFHLNRACPWGY